MDPHPRIIAPNGANPQTNSPPRKPIAPAIANLPRLATLNQKISPTGILPTANQAQRDLV